MREGFAQRLFLGIAQRRAHRRVARRHPLIEIGGEDIVVRLLEDGAEAPLAFLERGFGVLSLGDVERDAQQPRALLRSEEHTSALQSLMRNSYAVLCLKKKTNTNRHM